MITDNDDNELTYWPISGLIEGETSEVLTCKVTVPDGVGFLSANQDSRVKIMARKVGDASYIDISDTPYDLTGLSGTVSFEMYVEALSPIEGLERVAVAVIAGSGSNAGWSV